MLRADSGFCREQLMGWCESHQVDCLFGLARNQRLRKIIGTEMHQAHILHQSSGKAARVFGVDFALSENNFNVLIAKCLCNSCGQIAICNQAMDCGRGHDPAKGTATELRRVADGHHLS